MIEKIKNILGIIKQSELYIYITGYMIIIYYFIYLGNVTKFLGSFITYGKIIPFAFFIINLIILFFSIVFFNNILKEQTFTQNEELNKKLDDTLHLFINIFFFGNIIYGIVIVFILDNGISPLNMFLSDLTVILYIFFYYMVYGYIKRKEPSLFINEDSGETQFDFENEYTDNGEDYSSEYVEEDGDEINYNHGEYFENEEDFSNDEDENLIFGKYELVNIGFEEEFENENTKRKLLKLLNN